MNKRANRKAFFILLCVGLMYLSTAFNVMEKISMKRTLNTHAAATPAGFSGTIQKQVPVRDQSAPVETVSTMEPGLFIAIPIVMSAIKEGTIEKEGLILIKGKDDGRIDFKKPFDILRDKDEEGLISIAEIIGKKQIYQLLKKEDVALRDDLTLDDLILGKGYTMDRRRLLALFTNHATDEGAHLFPFVHDSVEIIKTTKGFEMAGVRGRGRTQGPVIDAEWAMPDLANLPMKTAIEKLAEKTSRIKIYGSGYIMDQNPKAFEKVKGEAPCVLYGRSYK